MKNFILGFLLAAVICMGFFCYTYYTEVKSFKESINSLQTQINTIVEEQAAAKEEASKKKVVEEKEDEEEKEAEEDTEGEEQEEEETTSKKKAVDRVAMATAYEKIIRDSYKQTESTEYAVADIDGDEAEELLVLTGDSEAEKMITVYTYEDKAVNCGEIGASHTVLYEMNKKAYLLKVNGHMGFETIYSISLKDGKVVEKELENNEVGAEDEYTEGDKEVKFVSGKDDSLVASLSENE